MALGTRVYNRAMEKQICRIHVGQILSGPPESVKMYQRHDGSVLTEYQIKDACRHANSAGMRCYPHLYKCDDGRTLTKYDIKAALRQAKRIPERIFRKNMDATIADVEDFLSEQLLFMYDDPEEPAPGYKELMKQTAPVGFRHPTEEKRLSDDFVLHFPEYQLSVCLHMN